MIAAALFDMDGTLVDSEPQTDAAIASVLARRGRPGAMLPAAETRGRTWGDIVTALVERYRVDPAELEGELVAAWTEALAAMAPVRGAPEAVRALASACRIAVVSSSPRALIDRLLDQIGVSDVVAVRVGADDVARPKPDPEGFLRAAELLGVRAADCVVFEDSSAGLVAARAAGMASIAVLAHCAEPDRCCALATRALRGYDGIAADVWRRLVHEGPSALP